MEKSNFPDPRQREPLRVGRRRGDGKRMDSGGRSERKRVGSDGNAPVILCGAYHGYASEIASFPGSEAEWHRGYSASARNAWRAGAFFIPAANHRKNGKYQKHILKGRL